MARTVFDAFLAGDAIPEKALLPAAEPLAARIGSMATGSMMSDPAHWSGCLAKAGRLLNLDGLILGMDPGLVSEAYGVQLAADNGRSVPRVTKEQLSSQPTVGDRLSSGRLGHALEALNRLVQTEKPHYGCVAALSGPAALAQTLFGDSEGAHLADLKQSLVELAEAFCKVRPDLLLFREGHELGNAVVGMPHRKVYNTVKNMAGYFNVPVAVYLEDYNAALLPDLGKLKIPFILLGADQNGQAPDPLAVRELAAVVDGVGVPLPFDDPENAAALVESYREQLQGVNYLYTSMHELTRETDLEKARTLIGNLKH